MNITAAAFFDQYGAKKSMTSHQYVATHAHGGSPPISVAAGRRKDLRQSIFAIASLIALAGTLASSARADSVIVGYYHSNALVSYDASNTSTVNFTTTGVTPEGVGWLMGSPLGANVLLVGNPSSGHVELVNASTGTIINSNYINGPGSGFNELAGMALSSNGQDLYVTSSSGSGSGIYEYNTVTGALINSVSLTGAHDVTFYGGYLYASAYENNVGVVRFNANLTNETTIVAAGDNGLNHATGMAFNGNTLYVGNAGINTGNGPSFVSQYTLSGSSATFDQTFANPTSGTTANFLLNPFGVTYYEGSIYVASLGDLQSNHGQITAINASTGQLSDYIPYTNSNTIAPKYVSFESQCVTYVPEPGSIVLLGLGIGAVGARMYFRRRRAGAI